ncbi:hypothetical protein JaAD80_16955 [Janthinobacterium sp. AD80]|nr:hypothetical protein JaAD80_16955 [Janthinobacterium sp. AD80]
MGRIAGQENAPLAEPVRDQAGQLPAPCGDQLERHVLAQGLADQCAQLLLGAVALFFKHEEPAPVRIRAQETLEARLVDVELADAPFQKGVRLGAAEQYAAQHAQGTGALAANAQLFAGGAGRAIGGDQVIGRDGITCACVALAQLRRDALRVLLHGQQFHARAQVGATCAGGLAQYRFQQILRNGGAGRGRGLAVALFRLAWRPRQFLVVLSCQACHAGAAHAGARRYLWNALGDAGGAEKFQRVFRKARGARMRGAAVVFLNEDMRHAPPGEEERG